MSDTTPPLGSPAAPITLLHLEDSDLDAEFIRARLEASNLAVAIDRVTDRKSFIAGLQERRYDVILSDYQVPTFEGLAALDLARQHQPDTPFLFVSGAMGEELAVETLKRGATDYVLKDRITRLPAAVERAITEAHDRVERARAEQDIARLYEELREADRRKTEFLATLGHELRNPLAPIRMGLEVLRMAGDDAEMRGDMLETMERQTQQMVRLIDDLLDVSRITQGKLQLRKSRVLLADVVQSAVEASRPFIDESDHELTVTLPAEPIYLQADPNRLAQVISNLLNNSAKYTPEKGRIQLVAERQDRELVVRIIDNGVGIPLEMQSGVFEMFNQIDRPVEMGYRGLGIGLTLVKRLVEMHRGSVAVRSEGEGCGSEFSVRLPILDQQSAAPSVPSEDPSTVIKPKLRILVMDDNQAAADMLRTVVQMLGHDVRTAYDGDEGITAAAQFRPDVVLMDLGMPKINGYQAARHIREQTWGSDMVLVALTGWGQDEDKQRTKEAGFDHHLVKPAEPATLQALLAQLRPNPV